MTPDQLERIKAYIGKAVYLDLNKSQCIFCGDKLMINGFDSNDYDGDIPEILRKDVMVFIEQAINEKLQRISGIRINKKAKLHQFRTKHHQVISELRLLSSIDKPHLTESGLNLIGSARIEFGYSPKTSNCDIFHTIMFQP